ncbi:MULTISPECIES: PD-(D/E)XK nuclease-like domain-containing protein [unclassified Microbacterium]|uniref:PD-(D/E)XK nuclease-like domain-containing protein n=1 Tax=unclassified Microbacterium TaxID=2609290 RepID=UPI00300FCFA2
MILHDLPDEAYHARPDLSSTGARLLLPEFGGSPAKFIWDKQHPRTTTKSYDVGHAVHAKVLGTGLQAVAYPDDVLASNGAASTKAAKEWADEQRALGFVPMKAVEVAVVNRIAEAVLANQDARDVLEAPHRETSIFTTSPEGVPVRARFDIYGTRAGDLKTCQDASPRGFLKHVIDYGYFFQEGWYRDAHLWETGEELESFRFIAAETTGPYQVAVHELDIVFRDIAKDLTRRARDVYTECVQSGVWPGVDGELLAPPTWMVYQHEEEQEIRI